MKSLKETLMARDGMTSEEADQAIKECKNEFLERLEEGDMSAADVLMVLFGLEKKLKDTTEKRESFLK